MTTATITTVCDVWVENSYRRANAEDGAYEVLAGYHVLAKVSRDDSLVEVYGYTGGDNDGLLAVCDDYAKVNVFVGRIIERGCINVADYWILLDCTDPRVLPDYVTNPHRPEYN